MWRDHLYQPQYDLRESYEEAEPGSRPPSKFSQLLNHLKKHKGRILARGLGAIGANYLFSKASGKSFNHDLQWGGPGKWASRYAASGVGAGIGDIIYDHFKKR